MSLPFSSTEQETLLVQEDGRYLRFCYDSIMNYHGGAMPAGVALAFRMFMGLTAHYQDLCGEVPERRSVSFYTGLGWNGQGIIDTAEAVYRVRSRGCLHTDIRACQEKAAPAAPGGGKYYYSGTIGDMSWEASVREGIIGGDFFAISRKIHMLHDDGSKPSSREIKELMDVRKATEQQLLKLRPDELFRFNIAASEDAVSMRSAPTGFFL